MTKKLYNLMNWPMIEEIVYSESSNPHELLGASKVANSTLIQAYFPDAKEVKVCTEDKNEYKMEMADEEGYFAVLIGKKQIGKYHYEASYDKDEKKIFGECYNAEPVISKEDIELFEKGIHYTIYEKLGAHKISVDGEEGILFAVWAPNALRVSVVGDFNGWDGRVNQMRRIHQSGVFELFIPGVNEGSIYKFEIKAMNRETFLKADPYAFMQQKRPETASVVASVDNFKWEDAEFVKNRTKMQGIDKPMNIYELYLGSFAEPAEGEEYANYREIAPKLIDYVKNMGYTHVELMPVMEHPFDASWGYQIIGYYAPTSRYGTPEDFMYFMNELHKAGIGVILDWVPAHFPRDEHGLAGFDGTCLYEHQDPRKGAHPHWGTLIYNYGRNEVKNYLIANALYWVEKFHADGIRMDAVASMLYLDYGKGNGEWVANEYGGKENLDAIEFIKHLNSIMKIRNEGVLMIAEESTAWPKITGDLLDGGLGFDFKWDMGWMNDYLRYIHFDPYFRAHHHNDLTFSMLYAYSEKFMNVFSHDEVVHGKSSMIGKMPGTKENQFANLRLTYAYMMMHPGKKLLFMGQDIGEFEEFSEKRCVDWDLINYEGHRGVAKLMMDLNRIYRKYPCLYELDGMPEGFEWINCNTPQECFLTFVRKGTKENDMLVCVANFSGVEKNMRMGVPYMGKYKEILNTDSVSYDGSGIVNPRVKKTKEMNWDGRDYAIDLVVAPLSAAIFEYQPYTKAELEKIRIEKEKQAEKERIEREKREAAEKARREKEEKERLKKETELKLLQEKEAKERAAREKQEKAEAEASLASLRKSVNANKTKAKTKKTETE